MTNTEKYLSRFTGVKLERIKSVLGKSHTYEKYGRLTNAEYIEMIVNDCPAAYVEAKHFTGKDGKPQKKATYCLFPNGTEDKIFIEITKIESDFFAFLKGESTMKENTTNTAVQAETKKYAAAEIQKATGFQLEHVRISAVVWHHMDGTPYNVFRAAFVAGTSYKVPQNFMKSAGAEICFTVVSNNGKTVKINSYAKYNGTIAEAIGKNKKLCPGSAGIWWSYNPETNQFAWSQSEFPVEFIQIDTIDIKNISRWAKDLHLSVIDCIPITSEEFEAWKDDKGTATSNGNQQKHKTSEELDFAPVFYPVSEELARQHKEMISFDDYKQGKVTAEYQSQVSEVFELCRVSSDPEKSLYIANLYSKKLARWYDDFNRNGAICPSVLICGAGNFPTRKKEKQNARYDTLMKQYNAIQGMKSKIKHPHGYEIRRKTITAEEFENVLYFETVINETENRIQLVFDGKPEEEERNILKKNGFRWSPRFKAWQRQLTENAVCAVWQVVKDFDKLEESEAEATAKEIESAKEEQKQKQHDMQGELVDLTEKIGSYYDRLYEGDASLTAFEKVACAAGDDFIKNNPDYTGLVANFRGDYISSDRETAAFAFALADMGKIPAIIPAEPKPEEQPEKSASAKCAEVLKYFKNMHKYQHANTAVHIPMGWYKTVTVEKAIEAIENMIKNNQFSGIPEETTTKEFDWETVDFEEIDGLPNPETLDLTESEEPAEPEHEEPAQSETIELKTSDIIDMLECLDRAKLKCTSAFYRGALKIIERLLANATGKKVYYDSIRRKHCFDGMAADTQITETQQAEPAETMPTQAESPTEKPSEPEKQEFKEDDTKRFEVGKIYGTASICDSNCIFKFVVIKRSEHFVWLKDIHGDTTRRKIETRQYTENGYLKQEKCFPLGQYSMAPTLCATDILQAEPETEPKKPTITQTINSDYVSERDYAAEYVPF